MPPEPETPAAAPPEAAAGGHGDVRTRRKPRRRGPAGRSLRPRLPSKKQPAEPAAGRTVARTSGRSAPAASHSPAVGAAAPPPAAGAAVARGLRRLRALAPAPPAAVIAPGRPSPARCQAAFRRARPGQVFPDRASRCPPGVSEPLSPSAPHFQSARHGARSSHAATGRRYGDSPAVPARPCRPRPRQPGRPLAGQPAARPVVPPRAGSGGPVDATTRCRTRHARACSQPSRRSRHARGRRAPPPLPASPSIADRIRPGQPVVRGKGRAYVPRYPARVPVDRVPCIPPRARPGMEPGRAASAARSAAPSGRQARRPSAARSHRRAKRRSCGLPRAARRPAGPAADQSRNHRLRRHHRQGAFRKAGHQSQPGDQEADGRGIFATINQTLDSKLATEIAREFGASTTNVSYEEESHAGRSKSPKSTKDLRKARARGHHHGPRRSRQDVAARRHPRSQRGRHAKPAESPSTSARITSRRTAARSSSSIRPATKRSPACAPAAPRSPTSWFWWWRPTTA